jgi:hypothetical protein
LKKLWQGDRAERLIAGQKQLTFKAWPDHTGKKDDFLLYKVQNKYYVDLLGYTDNEAAQEETQETIQNYIQETFPNLAGDISSGDDFLSLTIRRSQTVNY